MAAKKKSADLSQDDQAVQSLTAQHKGYELMLRKPDPRTYWPFQTRTSNSGFGMYKTHMLKDLLG